MTFDAIVKDDLIAAANTLDVYAALVTIMDKAGIETSDVASVVFSDFDWHVAQADERFAQLVQWLETERRYAAQEG